ncbi:MAG: DUF309 domain-containing protein [Elusimicrobia bacterium]|nr:DUF309 domain-containing protein [Elusimicrobiota bacterium]
MMKDPDFIQGISSFNEGKFFEAHEAWEDCWRRQSDENVRVFLQGLIQIAAGFYKFLEQGNPGGARYLLERGLEKLAGFQDGHAGLLLNAFREDASVCLKALRRGAVHLERIPKLEGRVC